MFITWFLSVMAKCLWRTRSIWMIDCEFDLRAKYLKFIHLEFPWTDYIVRIRIRHFLCPIQTFAILLDYLHKQLYSHVSFFFAILTFFCYVTTMLSMLFLQQHIFNSMKLMLFFVPSHSTYKSYVIIAIFFDLSL